MNDIPRLSATPAVVVGACGHGLGIVRALGRAGVPVFVLESNRALPGAKTRLAQVQLVADINGLGLIDALLEFRRSLECPGPPVLFLTNDTMVRTVGTHWERLAGTYLLSWSESRGPLLPLLEKSSLAARCSAQGLAYPKTYLLRCDADIDEAIAHVGFPIIVKPARPLAGFKTALPGSRQELQSLVETCAADLPFLVQTFIAGDDTAIFFSALYLDRGRVLARFDGHKLRSKPLGHTTIAESCPDDEVFAQASKFFDGLDISGPVSLELKRDPNGTLWVIEPTVGRTDFWLGLCMENGVDLPLVEYQHQIQRPLPAPAQTDRAVWFNEERDPFGLVWFAAQPTLGLRGRRAVFLYLGAADFLPVATSLQNTTLNLFRSAWRVSMRNACSVPRLIRDGCRSVSAFVVSPLRRVDRASTAAVSVSGFPAQAHTVEIFRHPNQFPQDVRDLFNHAERSSVQLGCSWYENLIGTIFPDHGGVFIYVLRRQGDAIAALPILAAASAGTHRIDALANYYTSIYAPALAPQVCAQELAALLKAVRRAHSPLDCLEFSPMDPQTREFETLTSALRISGLVPFRFMRFANWHLPVSFDWATYLQQREGIVRSTIKRMGKRFASSGGTLQLLFDAEDLEPALIAYARVYDASWKSAEPYPEFVAGLARTCAQRGWLRMGIAWLNGRPVAAQIWIVAHGRADIYKLVYDEQYKSYAPGTLLTAMLMQHVIEKDRVTEVDYLTGDDPYKKRWMSHRRERWGIVAYNPISPRGLFGVIHELIGAILKPLFPRGRLRHAMGSMRRRPHRPGRMDGELRRADPPALIEVSAESTPRVDLRRRPHPAPGRLRSPD